MNAEQFQLRILTPFGIFRDAPAELVEIPSIEGQLGILAGHATLVTALEPGELTILQNGSRERFLLGGGFARIYPTRMEVLAIDIESTMDEKSFAVCTDRIRMLLGDSYDRPTIDAAIERAHDLVEQRSDFPQN